jgi:hypothetical protein
MMRRSHLSMMAAAAAAMSMAAVASPPPPPARQDKRTEIEGEKMSRQRKRWLERQARKQMRAHKKTRR